MLNDEVYVDVDIYFDLFECWLVDLVDCVDDVLLCCVLFDWLLV